MDKRRPMNIQQYVGFVTTPTPLLNVPFLWKFQLTQEWTFYPNAISVIIVLRKATLPNTVTTNRRAKCAAEPTQQFSTAAISINEPLFSSNLSSSSPHVRSCALHVLTSNVIINRRVPSPWWSSICPVERPSTAGIWILAMGCI